LNCRNFLVNNPIFDHDEYLVSELTKLPVTTLRKICSDYDIISNKAVKIEMITNICNSDSIVEINSYYNSQPSQPSINPFGIAKTC